MRPRSRTRTPSHLAALLLASTAWLPGQPAASQPHSLRQPHLPVAQLARENFGEDAPWFLANIPFLEIDDPEIQSIYFYRWKLFRSHLREIGPRGTTVLEFLPDVPWARHPFTDLNDSASFHLLEGRWLRSPATVNALIDHLYTGGGNDRHFSESIASAAVATTLVTGDPAPALRHLDTMQHIYNLWDDHFDRTRNLYWIEPLLDATEYTISSIDASGAGFTEHPSADASRNGFTGGLAFRPSINSYQFANAQAIAHLATLAHQPAVAADFTARAEHLRAAVLSQLWNPTLQHFTDRYQRSTPTVTAGDFIRGRELVGYTPWLYELPPSADLTPHSLLNQPTSYPVAWSHVLNPAELAGPFGLRTVEPTYPRYLAQYRFDAANGQPECQWNGPSWPFQTSQTLTALANLLDDYPQTTISTAAYLHLLRQYTHQHFLAPGYPDLQEDYNPDTGRPIVGLPRSHHYAHSTYIDLILSGLLGIRPRADNTLEIAPLLPEVSGLAAALPKSPVAPPALTPHNPATAASVTAAEPSIRYFALENLVYHGHLIGLIYDADGTRYRIGSGLSVFVDGHRVAGPGPLRHLALPLGPPVHARRPLSSAVDLAVNVGTPDGPIATASSSLSPRAAAEAIDGRMWFFPEIPNGWSPAPDESGREVWLAVDLRQPQTVASVELDFLASGDEHLAAPATVHLEYLSPTGWQPVPNQALTPARPRPNGQTRITFPPLSAQAFRVVMSAPPAPDTLRLIELKAFAP